MTTVLVIGGATLAVLTCLAIIVGKGIKKASNEPKEPDWWEDVRP